MRAHLRAMVRTYQLIWFFLMVALATAQERNTVPLPTWPESGRISQELSDRYVFLTKDKHTIVVLVPANPEAGMSAPKKIVRVPLWNNLAPSLSVSITAIASGQLSYLYTVSNATQAEDALGAWRLIVPPSDPGLQVANPTSGGTFRWAGAPATAVIAKQAIFPDAPLGRYLTWFHQDDNVVPPGGALSGFGVESSYRPGLTTAWFARGKLLQLDQSWPREVFQQLGFLEDRQSVEKYVVTVGPMFPPGTPSETILESFQTGIDRMVKTGWLNPASPFTAEVVNALRELGHPKSLGERPVLRARPGTNTESAVAAALRFSLPIRQPE